MADHIKMEFDAKTLLEFMQRAKKKGLKREYIKERLIVTIDELLEIAYKYD